MYRSQDSETLDELRAENAGLKKKLSEHRRRRFEEVKHLAALAFIAIAFFGAIFLVVHRLYSWESEALEKAGRWRDTREPTGFLSCGMNSWCRVYFEDKPPIRLNCSFDEGCMVWSDEN